MNDRAKLVAKVGEQLGNDIRTLIARAVQLVDTPAERLEIVSAAAGATNGAGIIAFAEYRASTDGFDPDPMECVRGFSSAIEGAMTAAVQSAGTPQQ